MALFIGRLASEVNEDDLRQMFEEYGKLRRCEVKSGRSGNYGFVTYDDERDAEDAYDKTADKELRGARINVEWAKESGRGRSRGGDRNCYECGRPGHIARECRERRYGGGGGGYRFT